MLQTGSERSRFDLDAEEFQIFLMIGTGDAVGARQGPAIDFQTNHYELSIGEAQAGTARAAKGEQAVVPVMDGSNGFSGEVAHVAGRPVGLF